MPRIHLALTVPFAGGLRTVTLIAYESLESLEVGRPPWPRMEERLLRLLREALRKLDMDVDPTAVITQRIADDEVWCEVEAGAGASLAVAAGDRSGSTDTARARA